MATHLPHLCQQKQILVVANMWNLPRLTTLCEREIAPYLSVDNVLAVYQAAVYHRAAQLEKLCIAFMVRGVVGARVAVG